MRDFRISQTTANALADIYARLADGGYLRIYGGQRPANATAPITSQPLLAEFPLADPSAPAAQNGVAIFAALQPATGLAAGEATFVRVTTPGGVAVCEDTAADNDLVAQTGEEYGLILDTRFISLNAVVQINYFAIAP